MTAREELIAAYAAQPAEYRSFFGVTTALEKRATVFMWRNYFTEAWGMLARVPEAETVAVALAILAELKSLKPERKRPKRQPAQSVRTLRRRKSA
jgi:hypothetical protein